MYSHLTLQVVTGAYSVLGEDGSLRDHVSGDAESGDLVGGGESEDWGGHGTTTHHPVSTIVNCHTPHPLAWGGLIGWDIITPALFSIKSTNQIC